MQAKEITNQNASAALTAHIANTAAHGATGAVVGTTNAQTLTNKTISATANTITGIANASIATGAAIDATKIGLGNVTNTILGYLANVTSDVQTQLNGKAATSHTHTLSQITDAGTAAGYNVGTTSGTIPVLGTGGKLSSSMIPASAITDTFVVASQAAMLALSTAETGDVAVRTDLNKSFILKGTSYSTLADWQELLTPTDAVLSVNGHTGTVVLTTSDIAEGSNLYYTTARVNTDAPNVTIGTANGLSLSGQQISLALATTGAAGALSSSDKTKLDSLISGTNGTVTSVALSMPSIFSVSGSPVTTSGTLTATLATQSANLVFAGPTTGAAAAPTFRSLVKADLPSATAYKDAANTFTAAQTISQSSTDYGVYITTTGGTLRAGIGFSNTTSTKSYSLTCDPDGFARLKNETDGYVLISMDTTDYYIAVRGIDCSQTINANDMNTVMGMSVGDTLTVGGDANISGQINGDGAGISNIGDSNLNSGINAAKIGTGVVSNIEFGYLDGVTSAIQTQLNGKAATSHTHTLSQITDAGTAAGYNVGTGANQIPLLDGSGKLVTSILPPLAINDTFVVASQAAMLALTAQRGDVAVRTDTNKSYVLTVDDPTTLANWQELLSTAFNGTVTSVALSMPGVFSVSGSPITTSGTFNVTLATQTANFVWAGPTTGSAAAPAFRALVAADIPNLDAAKITTGTLSDGLLSSNVPLKNGTNAFTGTNSFAAATTTFQNTTPTTGTTKVTVKAGAGNGVNDQLLEVLWSDNSTIFAARSNGCLMTLLRFASGGYQDLLLDTDGIRLAGDSTLRWGDGTGSLGTLNAGLAWSSTGILKITDGSTGLGGLILGKTDTASSGTAKPGLQITPTYNQTSTASSIDFLINRTETAIGSGQHDFVNFQVASSSKYRMDNTGKPWFATAISILTTNSILTIGDTSGNTRGNNAIDLQSAHVDSAHVASGAGAIAFGRDNKAAAVASLLIGVRNYTTTSSTRTIVIGYLNNQSGGSIDGTTGLVTGTVTANTTIGADNQVIGYKNQCGATSTSTVIGNQNGVGGSSTNNVVIGASNTSNASSNVIVGNSNSASTGGVSSNILIGNSVSAGNTSGVGIGNTVTVGNTCVAIGTSCTTGGSSFCVVIGAASSSTSGNDNVVIGYGNTANSVNYATVIGYTNTAGYVGFTGGYGNTGAYASVTIGLSNNYQGGSEGVEIGYGNFHAQNRVWNLGRLNIAYDYDTSWTWNYYDYNDVTVPGDITGSLTNGQWYVLTDDDGGNPAYAAHLDSNYYDGTNDVTHLVFSVMNNEDGTVYGGTGIVGIPFSGSGWFQCRLGLSE
jgi:hypothetical protein